MRPQSVSRGLIIAAMLLAGTGEARAAGDEQPRCRDYRTSVSIPGAHRPATLAGTLCGPDPAERGVLLITAHGGTYNRHYWDWPQDPATYSFVRNLEPWVSVLNLDLLGSGQNARPLSAVLTQQAQAAALHHVVIDMRSRGFERVVLVGHSAGAAAATLEAATYRDVDGLIVTGFMHRFTDPPPGMQTSPLHLAATDPAFAGRELDPGYLTTPPGTRSGPGLYHLAAADPAVMAYDDAHKDVVAAPHAAGFVVLVKDPSISRAVQAPVLSLQGVHDIAFCASPACPQARHEAGAWSPAAELELHMIEGAGHAIHLHPAAAATEFALVRDWLTRRFR